MHYGGGGTSVGELTLVLPWLMVGGPVAKVSLLVKPGAPILNCYLANLKRDWQLRPIIAEN